MSEEKNLKARKVQLPVLLLLFTVAMSFFGYLYEQIDFIPNYFVDNSIESAVHWSTFHQLTNPAYYHILPSAVSLVCLALLWAKKKNLTHTQSKAVIRLFIFMILINLLTTVAVTTINDTLFFAQQLENLTSMKTEAIKWSLLNVSRLILLYFCGQEIFQKFSLVPSDSNKP